jgi:hypothetical protein
VCRKLCRSACPSSFCGSTPALDLDHEGKLDFFARHLDQKDIETSIGKPLAMFTKADVRIVESEIQEWLDGREDPENLSFYQALTLTEFHAGADLIDALGDETASQLGLYVVEGDHPGSSFCGVAFDGDLDELNLALAHEGLNMIVRRGTL